MSKLKDENADNKHLILFAPDPHGTTLPIIRAGLEIEPAAIITVGDNEFPRKPLHDLFSPLFDAGIPVYTIEGNHGSSHTQLKLNRKYMLDGKIKEIAGIRVAGSSFYSGYGRGVFSDSDKADVLVSHHPPIAWGGRYVYEAGRVRREADLLGVKTIIHGHIHPRLWQADAGWYLLDNGVKAISTGGHFYDQFSTLYGHEGLREKSAGRSNSADFIDFMRGEKKNTTFINGKYKPGELVMPD